MRLIVDENVAGLVVRQLRDAGHDVKWIAEESPGQSDATILAHAIDTERILLTQDKDFAALSRAALFPPSVGVILLRVGRMRPAQFARFTTTTIGERSDWGGHFSVLDPGRVRMRQLTTRD